MSKSKKNKKDIDVEEEKMVSENNTEELENEEKKEEGKKEEKEITSEDKIVELEAEVAKWKDSYIRKVAEFENIKKRMEKEKEEFLKFSTEKLILKLLEVVDNLERAVSSSKTTEDFNSLVKGVEMTLNQINRVLTEEGVVALDAKGKEFNPYEHHAMMQEESEEHDDNIVIDEFQKGYKMKEKVIRPALVKVSKNKK
ncbi:nucleotide exchange factor GrpE [Haliovirga abyssi]|uniref:Protein GrpE n=1 Tax=Haliovirga abyssi TaxID=2996794 RepID=A0AAU9DH72_9FUSO|nr:nucleotide exchange factor GrpE [Haliovirga abyssi]BDU50069.1 nucleotide exchange factor GrpE [Haliovirga abyssi]